MKEKRLWILKDCTHSEHIIAICDDGDVAENILKGYFDYLTIDADEWLSGSEFIKELERINEAVNFIFRTPFREMKIGMGIFVNKFGVEVVPLTDKDESNFNENQTEWVEVGYFRSPSDPRYEF